MVVENSGGGREQSRENKRQGSANLSNWDGGFGRGLEDKGRQPAAARSRVVAVRTNNLFRDCGTAGLGALLTVVLGHPLREGERRSRVTSACTTEGTNLTDGRDLGGWSTGHGSHSKSRSPKEWKDLLDLDLGGSPARPSSPTPRLLSARPSGMPKRRRSGEIPLCQRPSTGRQSGTKV
ncbi:hypothetical protein K402DRAFT_128085 [Aulographum hederae CBS 113979]|uniref:Uncharacterized protein n=1 Tax=Aulographum hederae CBS 113979 TaxID=1176131 RepID=A0A6G1HER9_9PEZI|nr:hypothetical protein K402DRAFT_128085 [Aulographum hederae CBS 113979]